MNKPLTQHEIIEVFIQTAEPYSTRKSIKIIFKIFGSTYSKAEFDVVDSS